MAVECERLAPRSAHIWTYREASPRRFLAISSKARCERKGVMGAAETSIQVGA